MSEGQGQPSGSNGAPKAIASLAKKPVDTTRAGTKKMSFVPTLPVRRKKEDVKQESAAAAVPATSERGRGRGRGRGGERGRGRGAAPGRPPAAEMTASGPFAMGPARAGSSAWKSTPRPSAAPIVPMGPGAASAHGAGLTKSAPPTLKREREAGGTSAKKEAEDDMEVYSDPDEGVEIVDLDNVREMDWNAPESLRRERAKDRKAKRKVKTEEPEVKVEKGKGREISMDVGETPPAEGGAEVDLANALDLSESEDGEEMEDLIEDFAIRGQEDEELGGRHERLYFFQFPETLPAFASPNASHADEKGKAPENGKRVSFTTDTKPPAPGSAARPESVDKDEPPEHVDGVIGQLEIYRSGAAKMRLSNGIVMDVSIATQPSFLQQAVHVDVNSKNLNVLGEVSRRFVATPDLDVLLSAMSQADLAEMTKLEDDTLIKMDTT